MIFRGKVAVEQGYLFMCGRFTLTSPIDAVADLFGIESRANLPPRYNIAPRQVVMTVRAGDPSGGMLPRHIAPVEWGLVPAWMKTVPSKPMINARLETVDVKPSFRSAVKRRRCLIPANGWYEWKHQGAVNQPYALVADSPNIGSADGLFAFAAIWEVWAGPDGGDDYQTAAILTEPASQHLSSVHHRRPVVVMPAGYDHWLAAHDPLPRDFWQRCSFAPEDAFRAYRCDRRVGNIRFDTPECLQAAAPDVAELPRQPSLF